MAMLPARWALGTGITASLQLALFVCLLPSAFAVEGPLTPSPADTEEGIGEGKQPPRVPHGNTFQVVEDVEGIDDDFSGEWLGRRSHLPLLKLALPATYMSTLTDVNVARYAGKVEAQDVGVMNQLTDGIRLLDVRLWRNEKATDPKEAWFTEVPWRLSEDGKLLKSISTSTSPASFTSEQLEAVDVHSRTNLVDGLFKPVLQFLRKFPSEVVVVVFSAVNGNTHTKRNMIVEGSELAESLKHAAEQLKTFLDSEQPYSDNAHDTKFPAPPQAPIAVRQWQHPAYQSPWLDSFVRKGVSLSHFAEITSLIDAHWGPLMLHHQDMFVDGNNQNKSMGDSVANAESFREWQRKQGMALLGKPISELLDEKVRLILLIDDPFLSWFITTRSRSQVVAFVKADHLYDVSYRSESHFAPCASPHTGRSGEPSNTGNMSWPECRTWCSKVGTADCTVWSWKPVKTGHRVEPVRSRREGDLGSIWEENADKEPGTCELYTRALTESSFEAISQGVDCPHDDLMSSDLPWDNIEVMANLMHSILPVFRFTATPHSQSMRGMGTVFALCDVRASMLTVGSASWHEKKYGISKKLIRVLFAPPTPQVLVEASERAVYSDRGDVVGRFNSSLEDFLLSLRGAYQSMERELLPKRTINAIQIAKYSRIRSRLQPPASAIFFQQMEVLNPYASMNPHILALTVKGAIIAVVSGMCSNLPQDDGYGTAFKAFRVAAHTRAFPPPHGGASVTMWLCFIGIVTAISLCVFISTLWCTCHPSGFLRKVCHRRATAAGPTGGSGGVVSLSNVSSSPGVTA